MWHLVKCREMSQKKKHQISPSHFTSSTPRGPAHYEVGSDAAWSCSRSGSIKPSSNCKCKAFNMKNIVCKGTHLPADWLLQKIWIGLHNSKWDTRSLTSVQKYAEVETYPLFCLSCTSHVFFAASSSDWCYSFAISSSVPEIKAAPWCCTHTWRLMFCAWIRKLVLNNWVVINPVPTSSCMPKYYWE